jgi:sugar-phosphatase
VSPRHALLFDLDGVLVDSLAAVDRSWRWWAARHGLDPEPFVNSHGRPTRESIAELAPHLDADAEGAVVDEREATDTEGVVALPGATVALASERPKAIVTSGVRALALARLRAAGLTPPAVLITADIVTSGKPSPEPYLLAATRLGVDPAECIVFEDAPAGVQAGKAAGMRVVALTTTVPASELGSADQIVPDLAAYLASG